MQDTMPITDQTHNVLNELIKEFCVEETEIIKL